MSRDTVRISVVATVPADWRGDLDDLAARIARAVVEATQCDVDSVDVARYQRRASLDEARRRNDGYREDASPTAPGRPAEG